MSQALEAVAAYQPEWLRTIILPHWYERYGNPRRILDQKIGTPEQEIVALSIGGDGVYLLKVIVEAEIPEIANLPEVLKLGQVWQQQYEWVDGKMTWRTQTYPCQRRVSRPVVDPASHHENGYTALGPGCANS